MMKRLLLADDSITIQKVVGIIFATEDFELTMTGDGDSAFEKALELTPDLVIADISMPGKDGFELCRAIKSEPRLSRTSVLLLPGAFDHFDEARAEEVCADGWLTKPFESQALLDKVNQLIATEPIRIAGVGVPAEESAADAVTESFPAADETTDVDEVTLGLDAVDELAADEEIADGATDDIWDAVSFEEDDLLGAELEPDEGETDQPFVSADFEDEPEELEGDAGPQAVEQGVETEFGLGDAEAVLDIEDIAESSDDAEVDFSAVPDADTDFLKTESEDAADFVLGDEGDEDDEPLELLEDDLALSDDEEVIELEPEDEEVLDLSEEDIFEEQEEEPFVFVDDEAEELDADTIESSEPLDEIVLGGSELEVDDDAFFFDEPEELAAKPEELAAEPEELAAEPEELVAEPEELVAEPEEFAAEPEEFVAEPEELVAEPEEFVAEPEEFVAEPEELAVEPVAAAVEQAEAQLKQLSEEELKEVVARVAGPIVEKMAGELLERVAWEVVPDLAEAMIKEEIRKIKQAVSQ